jgi:hypothetical protein
MDLLAVDFKIGLVGGEQARAMLHKKRFPRVHFDLGDPSLLAVLNGRRNDGAVMTSFANAKVEGLPLGLADVFDFLHSSALSPVRGITSVALSFAMRFKKASSPESR